MGRIVTAQNPSMVDMPFTRFGTAVSVAGTTLSVDNTNNFAADDFIVLGEEGIETSEVVKVLSVGSITAITLVSGVKFAHIIDDPVRVIPFDKVKFYGAESTTITVGNLLATADVDVDTKGRTTSFHHAEGDNDWYYKFTYYNSVTGVESSLADSELISGGTSNDLYCSVDDVLDYVDYSKDDEGSPSSSVILQLIQSRTEKMNGDTNSSFRVETITTSDYKYVDGRGKGKRWYFLGKAPIISISGMDYTVDLPDETPTWTAMAEGRGNDYLLEKPTGYVYIVSDTTYPLEYPNSIRWYGTWGRSSVPDDVRMAVVRAVVYDLLRRNVSRAALRGENSEVGLDALRTGAMKDWEEVVKRYKVFEFAAQ